MTSHIRRFDHVGITVEDLDTVMAFFISLGFDVSGRAPLEGDFLDAVIGIPDAKTELVLLQLPDGGTTVELAKFFRPEPLPGIPDAPSNTLGLRSLAFEVDDLQAAVEQLAADGYRLLGGIGGYQDEWLMASVRGPEGIIVSLAQRIG